MSINDTILKATDEKLTSENWELIISACNAISDANSPAVASAFKLIRNRLSGANGNTQLYTLTLLNALAQGGTPHVKSAIAAPETQTCLEALAKNGHRTVQKRVFDIVEDLDQALNDADFSRFAKALLTRQKSSKPSAPADSQEDEQLKEAIRLSMQDQERMKGAVSSGGTSQASAAAASNAEVLAKINKPMPPLPQSTSTSIKRVRALYEYSSDTPGDLNFRPGQIITVLEDHHKDWWKGSLDGVEGIFPTNYMEYVKDAPPATEEDYIFAQAPNVEKLLSIFASASQHPGYSIVGNPDIQTMYDEVLALRPKLIQLIDEYSARKQKLMQLNRDVVEARQRYEHLVNTRMAPQTPGLGQYQGEPPRSAVPTPNTPQSHPSNHTSTHSFHQTQYAPSQPSYSHYAPSGSEPSAPAGSIRPTHSQQSHASQPSYQPSHAPQYSNMPPMSPHPDQPSNAPTTADAHTPFPSTSYEQRRKSNQSGSSLPYPV